MSGDDRQGGGSACADVWQGGGLACADVWFAAHRQQVWVGLFTGSNPHKHQKGAAPYAHRATTPPWSEPNLDCNGVGTQRDPSVKPATPMANGCFSVTLEKGRAEVGKIARVLSDVVHLFRRGLPRSTFCRKASNMIKEVVDVGSEVVRVVVARKAKAKDGGALGTAYPGQFVTITMGESPTKFNLTVTSPQGQDDDETLTVHCRYSELTKLLLAKREEPALQDVAVTGPFSEPCFDGAKTAVAVYSEMAPGIWTPLAPLVPLLKSYLAGRAEGLPAAMYMYLIIRDAAAYRWWMACFEEEYRAKRLSGDVRLMVHLQGVRPLFWQDGCCSHLSGSHPILVWSTSHFGVVYIPFWCGLHPLLVWSTSHFGVVYIPFWCGLHPLFGVVYIPFWCGLHPLFGVVYIPFWCGGAPCAVRKVGCFPPPVATGPRVLNSASPMLFLNGSCMLL